MKLLKTKEEGHYIGIEAGYANLLEAILDLPEWYHECHYMIRIILKECPEETIREKLNMTRTNLSNYSIGLYELNEELFHKIEDVYENLDE